MNHGHVTPNPDGSKARCGGPGMCAECSIEKSAQAQLSDASDEEAAQAHIDHSRSTMMKTARFSSFLEGAQHGRLSERSKNNPEITGLRSDFHDTQYALEQERLRSSKLLSALKHYAKGSPGATGSHEEHISKQLAEINARLAREAIEAYERGDDEKEKK